MEKPLSQLTSDDYISMAKIIDNNFIGNAKIIISPRKMGVITVTGHTEGKQCINCEVKIDTYMNKLNGVYIQNDDESIEGAFRKVTQPTLERIKAYLISKNYHF